MGKPLVQFTGREMAEQLELLAKAYGNIYPKLKAKYLGRALTKSARPLVKIYKQVAKQRYPGALKTYVTKGGKTRTRRTRGGLEQSAGVSKVKGKSEIGQRDATMGIFVGYRRNVGKGFLAAWLAGGTKQRATLRSGSKGRMPKTDLKEITDRKVAAQGLSNLAENLSVAFQQAAAQQLKNYDYESERYKRDVARAAKRRKK
jgi:hypothetical protein